MTFFPKIKLTKSGLHNKEFCNRGRGLSAAASHSSITNFHSLHKCLDKNSKMLNCALVTIRFCMGNGSCSVNRLYSPK